jgi:hypothetical protein
MIRTTAFHLSLLVILTLATGCASAPGPTRPSTLSSAPATLAPADCRQLSADIAKAEEAKRAAMEKEKNARKPIVPFMAAARFVSNKSAADRTDKQINTPRAEFTRQGCDRQGI